MSLETAGDGVKKAQTMERLIASRVQCSPYASGGKTKAVSCSPLQPSTWHNASA